MKKKKRFLSGITPSAADLHIGNYFGAVKQHVEFQDKGEAFYFVADYHALNTVHNKEELENNILNVFINFLAFGLDPDKCIFFRQSDVPIVTELQCILNNVTPLGLMKRCHAYKDKLEKGASEESINMGLFNYPILMAADILLYKSEVIPVGEDQKQHVEIAKELARRFNHRYGKVLVEPAVYLKKDVAVVVGTDGERKMSKSLGNYISVFADEKTIEEQIMSCVTDPARVHPDDPGSPDKNVVFSYLDLVHRDKGEVQDLRERYKRGKVGDVEIKKLLLKSFLGYFAEARERRKRLKNDLDKVRDIMHRGAEKARKVAKKTIEEVRESVGLNVFK
jgi:tryptophanyl-tRNA synthetase